jgi:dipeptidyl-peptidase-4
MHYPKMLAAAFAAALTLAVSPIYAQNTSTEPRPVTLDDVWGVYAFGGKSINGLRSMADGVHYTRLTRGEGGSQIEKFDYATGTSKGVLVTSKELEAGKNQPFAIQNYTFSPDEQYLLLETDLASIYRHSYTAKVGLYKIKDRSFVSLGDKPVQNAQLSPNGKWVAYVEDNNVWLFEVATGERRAVTTDGVRNRIINGAPDWVYEEEFSFHVALWWSPNSENLAFLRFDETDVASFSMDVYGSELNTSQQKFKYTKAGKAKGDEPVKVKTVRPWFFQKDTGWYLQPRYGARVLLIDGKSNAIFAAKPADIDAALLALIEAAKAGELDAVLELASRRGNQPSV